MIYVIYPLFAIIFDGFKVFGFMISVLQTHSTKNNSVVKLSSAKLLNFLALETRYLTNFRGRFTVPLTRLQYYHRSVTRQSQNTLLCVYINSRDPNLTYTARYNLLFLTSRCTCPLSGMVYVMQQRVVRRRSEGQRLLIQDRPRTTLFSDERLGFRGHGVHASLNSVANSPYFDLRDLSE